MTDVPKDEAVFRDDDARLDPEEYRIKVLNKRRMAWASFVLIAVAGLGLISIGLVADALAERIDKLSFIIGTVFGAWVMVVLAYFGASSFISTRR